MFKKNAIQKLPRNFFKVLNINNKKYVSPWTLGPIGLESWKKFQQFHETVSFNLEKKSFENFDTIYLTPWCHWHRRVSLHSLRISANSRPYAKNHSSSRPIPNQFFPELFSSPSPPPLSPHLQIIPEVPSSSPPQVDRIILTPLPPPLFTSGATLVQ